MKVPWHPFVRFKPYLYLSRAHYLCRYALLYPETTLFILF